MRRSSDFASVVRGGTRRRGGPVVVHQRVAGPAADSGASGAADAAPLIGLIVGRSVGGSVVRHQVARRLRAQLARRVQHLPAGSWTVVRALPQAASASSAELGAGLDRALAGLENAR